MKMPADEGVKTHKEKEISASEIVVVMMPQSLEAFVTSIGMLLGHLQESSTSLTERWEEGRKSGGTNRAEDLAF